MKFVLFVLLLFLTLSLQTSSGSRRLLRRIRRSGAKRIPYASLSAGAIPSRVRDRLRSDRRTSSSTSSRFSSVGAGSSRESSDSGRSQTGYDSYGFSDGQPQSNSFSNGQQYSQPSNGYQSGNRQAVPVGHSTFPYGTQGIYSGRSQNAYSSQSMPIPSISSSGYAGNGYQPSPQRLPQYSQQFQQPSYGYSNGYQGGYNSMPNPYGNPYAGMQQSPYSYGYSQGQQYFSGAAGYQNPNPSATIGSPYRDPNSRYTSYVHPSAVGRGHYGGSSRFGGTSSYYGSNPSSSRGSQNGYYTSDYGSQYSGGAGSYSSSSRYGGSSSMPGFGRQDSSSSSMGMSSSSMSGFGRPDSSSSAMGMSSYGQDQSYNGYYSQSGSRDQSVGGDYSSYGQDQSVGGDYSYGQDSGVGSSQYTYGGQQSRPDSSQSSYSSSSYNQFRGAQQGGGDSSYSDNSYNPSSYQSSQMSQQPDSISSRLSGGSSSSRYSPPSSSSSSSQLYGSQSYAGGSSYSNGAVSSSYVPGSSRSEQVGISGRHYASSSSFSDPRLPSSQPPLLPSYGGIQDESSGRQVASRARGRFRNPNVEESKSAQQSLSSPSNQQGRFVNSPFQQEQSRDGLPQIPNPNQASESQQSPMEGSYSSVSGSEQQPGTFFIPRREYQESQQGENNTNSGSESSHSSSLEKCKTDWTSGLPDLYLKPLDFRNGLFIHKKARTMLNCAYEEKCLSNATGAMRNLLRFPTKIYNGGNAPFLPPTEPEEWKYHTCHQHFHSMQEFAHFYLYNKNGTVVGEGQKVSFCLQDSGCINPCKRKYNCTGERKDDPAEQGISPGCYDDYMASLDCQWIDVTGIPLDNVDYTLKVIVNPAPGGGVDRDVVESSYLNNAVSCDITIVSESKVEVNRCVQARP